MFASIRRSNALDFPTILAFIKDYWAIIVGVAGALFGSGFVGWKLKPRVERLLDVSKLEAQWLDNFDKMRKTISDMAVDMTTMQGRIDTQEQRIGVLTAERKSQDEVIRQQEARLNKQAAEIEHLYSVINRLRQSFKGYVDRLIGVMRQKATAVAEAILSEAGPAPAELDEDA